MKLTESEIILIDNVLSNPRKFTRKSYVEYLESKKLAFSNSSINRYLENIYIEIGLKLHFPRNKGCEIIENETLSDYLEKFQFYKSLYFRHILQKSITENSVQNQFISFGFDTLNKNIELIEPILNSIIESKKIKIFYKKFQENSIKEYIVNPLFIKEYINRWYVIGDTEKIKNRVFALDRIENIEFLNNHFIKTKANENKIFDNIIGVNFSGKVEKVVLWISEEQYPYFETLPLHKTQKLIEKTASGFIISLDVCCNYELEQWILHYGNKIKVIEPQQLKEKILFQLKEILKNYENSLS